MLAGVPVTLIWDAQLEPNPIYDDGRPVATQARMSASFKAPRLTGRDIYRICGATPPPLIHDGRKPKARRKRRR